MSNFDRLVAIMARLRSPDGCPWDREQTHQSLKPYLLEETCEVLDAIDEGIDAELAEELGDVLLQVVFHAQIASETNRFAIEDVAGAIADKLIRRHPHVFGDAIANTPEEVLVNWNAIKNQEKADKNRKTSALDGVPRHLPALLRARRIQEKAAKVGFDWSNSEEVIEKVREEVSEFINAHAERSPERLREEFGDMLFALVNVTRFLDICPEEALTQCIRKFQTRFEFIESELAKQGKTPETSSLKEMDALWEQAKTRG